MSGGGSGLSDELLEECAGWVWEQLQEEGFLLAGELVELILVTERELGVEGRDLATIARVVDEEFRLRGVAGNPYPIDANLIREVLQWEDEFLGLAGMPRGGG
ncbi:MAG: hypothetical protein ACR2HN_01805 [Tepidiformaceae bacterium]